MGTMPDYRCYCGPQDAQAQTIELSNEESQHLVAANRAKPGSTVVAFDGRGTEWITSLAQANKRQAILQVQERLERPAPPFQIALAQALPKGKLFESILRRATEIGIQRVYPLCSDTVEVKIASDRQSSKDHKWQSALIEGAKQSGNPFLPDVDAPLSVDELLQAAESYELKLIASLQEGAQSLKRRLADFRKAHGRAPKSAIWMVGPEGDFSEEEYRKASEAGFQPVTLGPYVLRSETAAVSSLSILRHELSD